MISLTVKIADSILPKNFDLVEGAPNNILLA
jgi:hypothetical protein